MSEWSEEAYLRALLHVGTDATRKDIEAARRLQAQILHPDRFQNVPAAVQAEAERKMKEVNAACDRLITLANERQRQRSAAREDARRPDAPRDSAPRTENQKTPRYRKPDRFWEDMAITPLEIVLPHGSGYTLRADRPAEIVDESEDDLDDEVTFYLARRGRLLLFREKARLVEFVQSSEPHDLKALDTWPLTVRHLRAELLAPRPEHMYELDLVVHNLTDQPETWVPEVIVPAGDIVRSIAVALNLADVIEAVRGGSMLDELDDALRAVEQGGFAAFSARRALRRFRSEQPAQAWEDVLESLCSAVDLVG